MGGVLLLLGLCANMPNSSFLAGALPLSMSLSQSQLRLLSSVGVGILVGTSLIVIIPEGIEAATAPAEAAHMHRVRSLVRRTPWSHAVLTRGLPESIVTISTGSIEKRNDELDTEALVRRIINAAAGNGRVKRADIETAVEATGDDTPATPGAGDTTKDSTTDNKGSETAESGKDGQQSHDGDHEAEHDHDHEHEKEEAHEHEHDHAVPTFEIGFSLTLGFLLMFLIDRLPRHATESLHSAPQTRHISLDNLNGDSASVDEEADGFLGSLTPTPRRARSLATTTGLVIHAAADGIAMGASSTTSDMKLGFIIFAAIMIHKAPAAFGLTSLLLKQGLSKRAARGHLIVFSLAAPFGALTTWTLITLLGGGKVESDHWWTGMLLLFSGGTFLYVAMHAMQEDTTPHTHDHGINGYADSSAAAQRKLKGPQMRDTLATMGGMLVPLLTQFGHHH
ncbi:related to ATX2-Putative Golgi transporter involved in homeostasis of manganese ions [Fusarium oxysporum]|uniref:Related to ATX2-Putative Golgi transporter involved in homeostasis of manganese ions n=1 Tax=Fusarium oxysporum TaxID=5507 RepID=A0A2H3U2E4_FUSOX|nr:related to ATX2-Putative Golgi transporter involved in homeostasis of manganese ions [Fusarium oxysporum]